MKFLCLVHFAPGAFDGFTPEDGRRLDDATIEHDHKLRQSGHLLIASPLTEQSEAISIDSRTRLTVAVTDGPYAEAKEVVGGFMLIEAENIEQAVALLEDDPIAVYGRLEIRPLMEAHRHSATGAARPAFRSA